MLDNYKYLMGVDCSFTNMAFCRYNPDNSKIVLFDGDWDEALNWLRSPSSRAGQCIFVVENPDLDKTTFGMGFMITSEVEELIKYRIWLMLKNGPPPPQKKISDVSSKAGIAMRISRDVGKNQAAAQLFIKKLEKAGIPYIEIAPSKRQRVDKAKKKLKKKGFGNAKIDVRTLAMPTKMNKTEFDQFLGRKFEGKSTEHSRDAASLVYGKKMFWAIGLLKGLKAMTKKKPKSYPKTANGNYFLINKSEINEKPKDVIDQQSVKKDVENV